ncbi:MAG: sigma-54-dependent Fis family transcriptional regulator [bacterium]|nr:sigma-54-dependent Fis family transcriptional regulator [bacterium]
MTAALEKLQRVAPLDTTVLLQGESGTGKELAARFLHENHPRRAEGPLVCVHCGAIPENLLESELFGHMKGAFTGAERDRVGKFEQAEGGTLFLDEISTMSPEAQIRLLRVLQERRITRVGGTDSIAIDARVVVASNRDLRTLIEEGTFREDLFYRVSTFPISLPPLRDRTCEVAALAEHFSRRVSAEVGLDEPRAFGPEALQALITYDWPGNVRELANVVEYSIIQSGGPEIERRDLPTEIGGVDDTSPLGAAGVVVTEDGLSFRTAVTNLERELILQSLRLAEGNKARAAELLELKRTTFLEKLRRLEREGLVPEPRASERHLEESREWVV